MTPRICPELAKEIGLSESILLLQFEFWLATEGQEHGEYLWIRRTLREIRETFTFFSLGQTHRIVENLIKTGLLIIGQLDDGPGKGAFWYRLNPDKLGLLKSIKVCSRMEHAPRGVCSISDTKTTPNGTTVLISFKEEEGNTETALPRETTTQEKPRSKTLDPPIDPPYLGEEFLAALSQFEAAQKDLRCPIGPTRRKALYEKLGVWGEKVATFELLRAVEHGWKGVFREVRNGNGNGTGHKPADDYRGPGRNTESDAARKKRENCPDCNGTNNRLRYVTQGGRQVQVSEICKHENSTG